MALITFELFVIGSDKMLEVFVTAVELSKKGIHSDVRCTDYIEFVRGVKTLLKCLNKLCGSAKIGLLFQ